MRGIFEISFPVGVLTNGEVGAGLFPPA